MGTIINWGGGGSRLIARGGVFTWGPQRVSLPTSAVVIQALVVREERTDEGFLIRALEPAWLQISELVAKNPNALMELTPEQLEELVAASYDKAGYDEVTLTPRSGDFGRDVIAVRRGWGSVRIIDQVKRHSANNPVTANDVRALLGVLSADRNATKGIVSTTSTFAPLISQDPSIAPFVPHRLELVNGTQLAERLASLNAKPK